METELKVTKTTKEEIFWDGDSAFLHCLKEVSDRSEEEGLTHITYIHICVHTYPLLHTFQHMRCAGERVSGKKHLCQSQRGYCF